MSAHTRLCEKNPKRQHYLDCLKKQSAQGSLVGPTKVHNRYLASLQEYTFTCEHCGKEYTKTFSPKRYQHYLKLHHFCSQSCSNFRIHTPESRAKLSETWRRKYGPHLEHRQQNRCKYQNTRALDGSKRKPCELRKTTCLCCGAEIWLKTTAETTCYSCRETHPEIKKYRLYSSDGKRITSSKTKMKLCKSVQERITAGTHTGWLSRNIASYPEKFWKKVLENNGIEYSFNFPIKKRDLGFSDTACYFLDFKIGENIDLEIDGGQHLMEDRRKHDEERDSALTAHGWMVYRIPWNEINTEEGSQEMKEKIDRFLEWYHQKL